MHPRYDSVSHFLSPWQSFKLSWLPKKNENSNKNLIRNSNKVKYSCYEYDSYCYSYYLSDRCDQYSAFLIKVERLFLAGCRPEATTTTSRCSSWTEQCLSAVALAQCAYPGCSVQVSTRRSLPFWQMPPEKFPRRSPHPCDPQGIEVLAPDFGNSVEVMHSILGQPAVRRAPSAIHLAGTHTVSLLAGHRPQRCPRLPPQLRLPRLPRPRRHPWNRPPAVALSGHNAAGTRTTRVQPAASRALHASSPMHGIQTAGRDRRQRRGQRRGLLRLPLQSRQQRRSAVPSGRNAEVRITGDQRAANLVSPATFRMPGTRTASQADHLAQLQVRLHLPHHPHPHPHRPDRQLVQQRSA